MSKKDKLIWNRAKTCYLMTYTFVNTFNDFLLCGGLELLSSVEGETNPCVLLYFKSRHGHIFALPYCIAFNNKNNDYWSIFLERQ